jgi:hypothetical protein
VGAALDLSGRSMFGSLANAFGSGMFSEAVNVPGAEGMATIPTQNAYARAGTAGGGAGMVRGAYSGVGRAGYMPGRFVQSFPSMQPGTF